MNKLTGIMVLAVILVATVNVSANEWTTPGGDPTVVSWTKAIPQLKNCPIESDRMIAAVQTNHGDPIWVKRGEFFSEMTGGTKVYQHMFAAFADSIPAYSWRFIVTNSAGWIELVIFPKCGNAAWRFVPLCPEQVVDSSATIATIATAKAETNDDGFPWWILGLLGLLGLFGLTRKYGPIGPAGRDGRDGRDGRVLYVNQDGSTSETKPEPPAPIESVTIPVEVDRLTQLRNLRMELTELDAKREKLVNEIDELTAEIRSELDGDTEAATDNLAE